jgi:hypothetical protein
MKIKLFLEGVKERVVNPDAALKKRRTLDFGEMSRDQTRHLRNAPNAMEKTKNKSSENYFITYSEVRQKAQHQTETPNSPQTW